MSGSPSGGAVSPFFETCVKRRGKGRRERKGKNAKAGRKKKPFVRSANFSEDSARGLRARCCVRGNRGRVIFVEKEKGENGTPQGELFKNIRERLRAPVMEFQFNIPLPELPRACRDPLRSLSLQAGSSPRHRKASPWRILRQGPHLPCLQRVRPRLH